MSDEFQWLYEKDLKYLTRAALEEECDTRGISTDAKRKQTLVNRIIAWQENQAPDSDVEDVDRYEIDEEAEKEARAADRGNADSDSENDGNDDGYADDEQPGASSSSTNKRKNRRSRNADADAFMSTTDEAYDEGDEVANEKYAKRHGLSVNTSGKSPLIAAALALVVAGLGFGAYMYLTYEEEAHAQQMY